MKNESEWFSSLTSGKILLSFPRYEMHMHSMYKLSSIYPILLSMLSNRSGIIFKRLLCVSWDAKEHWEYWRG